MGIANTRYKANSRVRDLRFKPKPWIIPHRGGILINPEDSLTAFKEISAYGLPTVEMDVYVLSDNTTGIMHDSTIDRTSSSTGTVSTFTLGTWQAASLDPTNFLSAVGYTDGERLPIFSDTLAVLKGRVVVIPEAKNTGAGAALTKQAQRFGLQSHEMIVQSFTLDELVAPAAAGYQCLYLVGSLSSIADWGAIRALGIEYVGYGTTESGNDTRVASANAAGIRIIRYTRNRRKDIADEVAIGVDGVMTDDPIYASSSVALASRDTFSTGKWMPGMLASNTRGVVFSNGEWGYTITSPSTYHGCLMGWACPVANPTSYTIDFDSNITALLSGDTSRWFSVFIGASDDTAHLDSAGDLINGYQLLLRGTGQMQIYKKTSGNAATQIATASSSAVSLNTWISMRVTVTPTSITFTRLDTNTSVTANDAAYRGGYFFIGRSGAAVKFKNIVIT